MTKRELRSIYLTKRKELNSSELAVRSEAICDRLFLSTDFSSINVVHVFLPILRNNEPNTWLIIDRLRQNHPQVRISVPRIKADTTGEMEHIYLERTSEFLENKWGISEIANGELTMVEDIDLVLVPLVAFDITGNRVGYGKGFYDRFLNACRNTTIRTGISLFEVVEQIDDIDQFDQPLHYCVTPFQVHAF